MSPSLPHGGSPSPAKANASSFVRLAWDFYRERPGLLAANLSFMAFMPLNEVLLPHLFGLLVEAVEKGRRERAWRLLVAAVGLLALTQGGTLARDWLDTRTTPELEGYVRSRMLQAVLARYDGRLEEPDTGEMIARFVRAPHIISNWIMRVNDYIAPFAIVLLVAFGYFVAQDAVLAAALGVLIAVLTALLVWAPARCHAATMRAEREFGRMHDDVEEVLRNLASVYGGDRVDAELRRLATTGERHQQAFSDTMRCALRLKLMGIPAVVGFFAAFVARCVWLVSEGRLSSGKFASLFMVVSFLLGSLAWIVSILRDVVFDAGTLGDIAEQLQLFDPPAVPRPSPRPPPPSSPPHATGIGLSHVTYMHPNMQSPVLRDVSLHFEVGERTALLGAIGCGKSTVLRLLMGFYQPTSGGVYLGGRWYGRAGQPGGRELLTSSEVRLRLAYVPQEAALFDRSVLENVAYGNPGVSAADVLTAFRRLGIEAEFGGDLHRRVGKGGSRLSGGQRQLVWFMRAVMHAPEVLVLDEPTASMDERSKQLMLRVLEAPPLKGCTVVMVTHDPFLVAAATRRVTLRREGPM
jgi:ATP-binding cassette subfamily C protein LapB